MSDGSSAMGAAPDGGSRAWLVMIGSFLCNGLIFGLINTYSVIFVRLLDDLKADNVADASSKAGECIRCIILKYRTLRTMTLT